MNAPRPPPDLTPNRRTRRNRRRAPALSHPPGAALPEGLAQRALEHLPRPRLRQLIGEGDRARHLVAGEVLAPERRQGVGRERLARPHYDDGMDGLAPLLARDAEDGHFLHGGMAFERGFDLGG